MPQPYTVSIDVAVPPDAAWEVVGAPCGVTRWYSLYIGCEVEGDTRTLERADGAVVVERLLERDDERRIYSYSVLSGLPLKQHRASFEVVPADGGSRVLWTTDAVTDDPADDLEARLAPRQREALEGLRALLEGG